MYKYLCCRKEAVEQEAEVSQRGRANAPYFAKSLEVIRSYTFE